MLQVLWLMKWRPGQLVQILSTTSIVFPCSCHYQCELLRKVSSTSNNRHLSFCFSSKLNLVSINLEIPSLDPISSTLILTYLCSYKYLTLNPPRAVNTVQLTPKSAPPALPTRFAYQQVRFASHISSGAGSNSTLQSRPPTYFFTCWRILVVGAQSQLFFSRGFRLSLLPISKSSKTEALSSAIGSQTCKSYNIRGVCW